MAAILFRPRVLTVLAPLGLRDNETHESHGSWRHQAITWTNIDLSSVRSIGIHQRAISQETPQPLIIEVNVKINYLKSHSNLPGANELKNPLRVEYIITTKQIK